MNTPTMRLVRAAEKEHFQDLVDMFIATTGRKPTPQEIKEAQQIWEEEEKEHKYGCVHIRLPDDLASEILYYGRKIPPKFLTGEGLEEDPHITVKYGLHTDNPEDVTKVITGFGPIHYRLLKPSVFLAEESQTQRGGADASDVVILMVESQRLRKLNALISSKLKVSDTHPEYKPHIIIAYVRPGYGQQIADALKNHAISAVGQTPADSVVFSNAAGEETEIPL